jgi:hypothetical protein
MGVFGGSAARTPIIPEEMIETEEADEETISPAVGNIGNPQ